MTTSSEGSTVTSSRNNSHAALIAGIFFGCIAVAVILSGIGAVHAQEPDNDGLARYRALRAEAEELKHGTRALELYDEIISAYADHRDEAVQEGVAWAMLQKGTSFHNDDKERTLAAMIAKFGDSEDHVIRRHVARAKFRRALFPKDKDARVGALDILLAEYRDDADPEIQNIVDDIALARADALEDAAGIIAICDSAITRLAGNTGEESRDRRARMMLRKATAIEDSAEKIKLLDEVIAEYGDDTGKGVQYTVERSFVLKAKAVPENAEKRRIFDELLARCAERGRSFRIFMDDRMELEPDAAAKQAAYESILAKYGDRLEPGDVISMMYSRTNQAATDEEKSRLFGEIIQRFGDSPDGSTDFYLTLSMSSQIRLLKDKNEKIALYDALIAKSRTSSDNFTRRRLADAILDRAKLVGGAEELTRASDEVIDLFTNGANGVEWSDYASAVDMKVKASGDDSIRDTLYDAVITGDFDEFAVSRARLAKAEKATSEEKQRQLYDELIARHQDSDNSQVSDTVLKAMVAKEKLLRNKDEKIAALQAIVEKYDKYHKRTFVSGHLVDDAVRDLAHLTGDKNIAIRNYDKVIDSSSNEVEVVGAMAKKSEYLDGAAKIAVYDEIITGYHDSTDRSVQRHVVRAILGKASLITDIKERIRLYETVMTGFPGYDERVTADGADIAFWSLYNLLDTRDERLRLIDRYLTKYRNDITPFTLSRILKEKADSTADPATAAGIYDELIDMCRAALAKGSNVRGSGFISPMMTRTALADALSAKAKFVEDPAEKLKLYDEILSMAAEEDSFTSPYEIEKVLAAKIALTGDAGVRGAFYDERIKAATTDVERARWLKYKADALDDKKQSRDIRTDLARKFADSDDARAQRMAANALIENAKNAPSAEEALRLYDSVLETFGKSDNTEVTGAVVKALLGKARLEKKREEKLKLYGMIIDKYLDTSDYSVKNTVDTAIAERFRLTDKDAAKR